MATDDSRTAPRAHNTRDPRAYIGIHFECCGVYARIYRQPDDDHYVGRCPRCLRVLTVRVGPGGVATRIFSAR